MSELRENIVCNKHVIVLQNNQQELIALLAYKLLVLLSFASARKRFNSEDLRLTLQPCFSSTSYNLSKPQELNFLKILFFKYTFNL